MKKFAELVLKYRIGIIILTIILTVFMAYQLRNLEINSDITKYLPKDDPNVILFNEVGAKFGGNSLAMVALETDDVFNVNTINRINDITRIFKNMPEISYVTSLTDVIDIKKNENGLEIGKVIENDEIPTGKKELKMIKEYVLSKEMYRGNIVSEDGTIALIIARLEDNIDKISAGGKMKDFVFSTKGNEKLYFSGIPFQMIFLSDIINSDIILLLPIVFILMIIVLGISFRSKRGVILPLATVIISTTWALGLMSLLGIKLTIASEGMPILLLAIGSAYGIHLLNNFMENIHKGNNKIEAIKNTLDKVGIPIFLAGLTTAIGFLAFLTSNLTLIKEFGIFTGIGVLFSYIVSVTFLPVLLSIMKEPKIKKPKKSTENSSINWFMKKLSIFIIKKKILIAALGFVVFALGVFSIFNIDREVNMVEYFKKDSEIRQAEEMMESKLGGSIPIQIVVKGDLKEPAVLKEVLKLEKFIKSLPNIHNPQSIADLICEMNYVMNDRYCIPDTKKGIANLWFFLEGNEVLPQLINSENNEGLIQAKCGTVNTKELNFLTDIIDQYISDNIDQKIVTIVISEVGSKTKKIRQLRVENVVEKILYDALYYNIEIKDKVILSKILEKYFSWDFSFGFQVVKSALSKKLSDYFSNEESDLQIKSISTRKKMVKSLISYIEQNRNFTVSDIEGQLLKVVPRFYYEDDPELLSFVAVSIDTIIKNEMEWSKLNSLVKEISPLFTKNLSQYPDFKRNLIGNLWEINKSQITIPYSDHKLFNDENQIKSSVSVSFQQTGMPIVYKDIDRKIVSSQAYSLVFAIGLVLILLMIQFRSYIGGLISIFPIILTVLFNFFIMWVFKIPLDAATVMIGSVAVGIGIDYTIHFNSRFRFEIASGKSANNALESTLLTVGRAIMINAISVMIGFLTLLWGSIVPMQRFGWLIALTMIISASAAIIFLPSLILLSHSSFLGELKNTTRNGINGIKSNIKKKLKNLNNK